MATCAPELSGWAGRILEGLPDGTATTGGIVSYFQYNLVKLNSRIYTDFTLSGSCIVPDMTYTQSGIFEQIYLCDYLSKQAISNLGTAAYSWVEVDGHDQSRIRKVAKTTIAQNYRVEAKACNEALKELVDWYNGQNNFGLTLGMVINSERGPNNEPLGSYGQRPGCFNYLSSCNSVFNGAYLIQECNYDC